MNIRFVYYFLAYFLLLSSKLKLKRKIPKEATAHIHSSLFYVNFTQHWMVALILFSQIVEHLILLSIICFNILLYKNQQQVYLEVSDPANVHMNA